MRFLGGRCTSLNEGEGIITLRDLPPPAWRGESGAFAAAPMSRISQGQRLLREDSSASSPSRNQPWGTPPENAPRRLGNWQTWLDASRTVAILTDSRLS